MTNRASKTPIYGEIAAGRTPSAGSPGTWPIGGSLPSSFLDRETQKGGLLSRFPLLFSSGFLIFNAPPTSFPSSPQRVEPRVRECISDKKNFVWNQPKSEGPGHAPLFATVLELQGSFLAELLCKWQEGVSFTLNRK